MIFFPAQPFRQPFADHHSHASLVLSKPLSLYYVGFMTRKYNVQCTNSTLAIILDISFSCRSTLWSVKIIFLVLFHFMSGNFFIISRNDFLYDYSRFQIILSIYNKPEKERKKQSFGISKKIFFDSCDRNLILQFIMMKRSRSE